MAALWNDAFRGRTVLVTGHTGFKGSWLCLWLARLGAKVVGLALDPPTVPNNFTLSGVREALQEHVIADVRDVALLIKTIERTRPDVVLHLAAQTVVRTAHREPLETWSVNVMGTVAVLEAIRLARQPCATVIVTSDKAYDNREQVWGFREEDPLGDRETYGASKGAAELATRAYRESFFPPERLKEHSVKIASARAGNVIGGGDWTADALIVDIVRAVQRREPVAIRRPDAFRPWQHVLQALSGYLTLAARLLQSDDPALCSGWNIGPLPGSELPVSELVALFLKEMGGGKWIDASDPAAPHEAIALRLCIDKALWQLPWRPEWSLPEVLAHTAAWYRRWLAGDSALQEFSLTQIAAYEAAMQTSRGNSP